MQVLLYSGHAMFSVNIDTLPAQKILNTSYCSSRQATIESLSNRLLTLRASPAAEIPWIQDFLDECDGLSALERILEAVAELELTRCGD